MDAINKNKLLEAATSNQTAVSFADVHLDGPNRTNPTAAPAFESATQNLELPVTTAGAAPIPVESPVANAGFVPTSVESPVATAGAAPAQVESSVATAGAAAPPVETIAPQTNGDATATPTDANNRQAINVDVRPDRERLEQLIPSGPNGDQIRREMNALESRNPPLPADQIAKIYESTAKLLDSSISSPLTMDDRALLAGSLLLDAAHPTRCDQGLHETCNVTALEKCINQDNPEKFAEIVTEVGLTGKYKATDGTVITIDSNSLRPDRESVHNYGNARDDMHRNYATQVFDLTMINAYWQRQIPPVRYSQVPPRGQGDTGERMNYIDHDDNGKEISLGPVTGANGRELRDPGLGTAAIALIGKELGMSGRFVISNVAVDGGRNPVGTERVASCEQFERAIADRKSPSVIMVNAGNNMFADIPGQPTGMHVVTVSDYKAGPPAMVFLSNEWGARGDKWVTVSDLYEATFPANTGHDGKLPPGGRAHGGGLGGGGVLDDSTNHGWREGLFQKYLQEHNLNLDLPYLRSQLEDAKNRKDQVMIDLLRQQLDQALNQQNAP